MEYFNIERSIYIIALLIFFFFLVYGLEMSVLRGFFAGVGMAVSAIYIVDHL